MCEAATEVRLPTSKKEMPKGWFKNLLGAFGCLENLWSKKCSKCGEVKPINEFHTEFRTMEGRTAKCKDCRNKEIKGIEDARSNRDPCEVVGVERKVCAKCKLDKASVEYNKNIRRPNGLQPYCKGCEAEIGGRYINQPAKKKMAAIRRSKWAKAKRPKINARVSNKLNTDVNYKIGEALRTRTRASIKRCANGCKAGSAVKDCGCSMEFLRAYLEARFQPGMTWKNWGGHGWHIDHITPLDAFDLTNREQFLTACHYTNLQPLWWYDNLSKNSRLNW